MQEKTLWELQGYLVTRWQTPTLLLFLRLEVMLRLDHLQHRLDDLVLIVSWDDLSGMDQLIYAHLWVACTQLLLELVHCLFDKFRASLSSCALIRCYDDLILFLLYHFEN